MMMMIRGSMRVALGLLLGLSGACSTPVPPAPPPQSAAATSAEVAAGRAPPPEKARPAGPPGCNKEVIAEVVGTPVWRLPGSTAFGFRTGMKTRAAGAPKAYHPDDSKAIDDLANAGRSGRWAAIATHNGKPDGKPLLQGPADPAPGYYVSTTALFDKAKPAKSPKRYVDASKVPYVALPEQAREWGAELGDLAVVMNAKNGRIAFAVFADYAPPAKLGQGSIALADAINVAASPRDGGVPAGVVYVVFPKSGKGVPRSIDDIDREGKKLFDAVGGRATLGTCFR
ncbi:Hypothetical protein A7982_03850 [Minicystis rosea]|nr:Hypothetical protein A7982_03850 [Minicystis rosea]